MVSNRTVVVTGGADGIGKAIALAFLAAGDRVHVCDVRNEAIDTLAKTDPALVGHHADVGDPASVSALFNAVTNAHGPVDVLVNNVGIGGPRAMLGAIALDEWNETFRINVTGMLLCMQAAIPGMTASKRGAIVNISTASTETRLPERTAYIASKYAVEGLTLNAARELGPLNIRVNGIRPGLLNNARMDSIVATRAAKEGRNAASVLEDFLRFVSLRQRTEPEDVAAMAVFLASDAAARVTGQLISVSGNLEWES